MHTPDDLTLECRITALLETVIKHAESTDARIEALANEMHQNFNDLSRPLLTTHPQGRFNEDR